MRLSTAILFTIASFITITSAAFDPSSNTNVALYWGQNSAGSQQDLAYYCQSDDVDILLLSFVTGFTDTPTLNFANACSETYPNGVLKCDQIAADIKTCQSNGKKILLSLGGSAGSYGFSSDTEAEAFATTLWNLFGEGNGSDRPFGDSVVDGFDFDIENNIQTGYVALSNKLKEYYASGSKDYYLSAAPQCVYPDASIGDVLSQVEIDFAFIQFYNNYCNVDKQFNWDTWASYAANTSPNKNIKLFLGLPGAPSAAGSGYVDIDTIDSTLLTIGSSSSFGGVMLWDASQGFANQVNGGNFVSAIKGALNSIIGGSSNAASTPATATTSTVVTASALTSATVTLQASTSSTNQVALVSTQVIAGTGASVGASAAPEQDAASAQQNRITTTLTSGNPVNITPVITASSPASAQYVSALQNSEVFANTQTQPASAPAVTLTTSIFSERTHIDVAIVTELQTQTITVYAD